MNWLKTVLKYINPRAKMFGTLGMFGWFIYQHSTLFVVFTADTAVLHAGTVLQFKVNFSYPTGCLANVHSLHTAAIMTIVFITLIDCSAHILYVCQRFLSMLRKLTCKSRNSDDITEIVFTAGTTELLSYYRIVILMNSSESNSSFCLAYEFVQCRCTQATEARAFKLTHTVTLKCFVLNYPYCLVLS